MTNLAKGSCISIPQQERQTPKMSLHAEAQPTRTDAPLDLVRHPAQSRPSAKKCSEHFQCRRNHISTLIEWQHHIQIRSSQHTCDHTLRTWRCPSSCFCGLVAERSQTAFRKLRWDYECSGEVGLDGAINTMIRRPGVRTYI